MTHEHVESEGYCLVCINEGYRRGRLAVLREMLRLFVDMESRQRQLNDREYPAAVYGGKRRTRKIKVAS